MTGATGNMGSELVSALAEAGEPVRALTSDPSAVTLPPGAETVGGDLNRPQPLTDALEGVSGIFLLPGYQDMPGLLAQARTAGVERVVLLSGARPRSPTSTTPYPGT
ncbi:NAD(P)H-binding protein [Streptomyces sp. NPDC052012]|uniref:SDR family oxidoreductase n=1 Tax=Streptomyces sp. NPDC052012 TaxID=3155051 RepID=UPI00344F5C21